ncbi:sigma-70 family RNA polymerase sigma factor [Solihabitans fulvus]|uniref:Sigma-70 family RNA polymerase sigma factor n=1 Tax=Solihabitans fulvus TaxID=1892852 RepID=A0A5B2XHA0_9PSEU|nr:sigma-70 family RNA polymerase sigma factor [Solihabitans fulvus]KAA2262439.1 sigma-70 family RNA polymerase sigma factor [Solihabitans fulvus]
MSELRTAGANPPWDGLDGSDRHAACMVAARDGDRTALDVLVTELTPLVWHVARGNGLDRSTAEDVVQTVWLALLRHLDRLVEPRALVGWLVTTTRREAQRSWRTNRGQVPLSVELTEQLPTEDWLPEDEALRDDRDRRLWTAFSRLNHRCQEILRLTVLAGRAEYRAVAEALSMPRGSIGPTRGRCLSQLRELLNAEGGSR